MYLGPVNSEPGAPERFRIYVSFSITEEMKRAAEEKGTTASELVRGGFDIVFARMNEQRAGSYVGNWQTDSDSREKRGREFAIGS